MNKLTITLVGIIAALAAYILFFTQTSHKVDVKAYEVKIDSLQHQVDSIYVENDHLDVVVAGYEDEILAQENKILSLKDKIVSIKQETHEKVQYVDSYTDDELERFFTERYKGLYSDSTAKADSTSRN